MNNEDFKVVLTDKEYIEKLEKEVHYQNKEVSRLNNIINELEKWLSHKKDIYKTKTGIENNIAHSFSKVALDKLKELKEGNNENNNKENN